MIDIKLDIGKLGKSKTYLKGDVLREDSLYRYLKLRSKKTGC